MECVWVIVRDLSSTMGPEVDVFPEGAMAQAMAGLLERDGREFIGPVEQPVLGWPFVREIEYVVNEESTTS